MSSNTIRFTGLSSGIDTESIVKAMLMTQQNKIDKQTKTQQLNTWKQEAWKDMNKKLADFQTNYVDKLRSQATFAKNKITTSNDSAVYINPDGNIPQGTHEIEIINLATSAKKVTSKINKSYIGDDVQVKSTTKLSELGITGNADGKIQLKLNEGTSDEKVIDISVDRTLQDVASAIHAADENLSVTYDEGNERFFISSKITGKDSKIKISAGSSAEDETAFQALGLKDTADNPAVDGVDATYKYNGTTLTSSTNKVTVNGIEMTLKAETFQPVTIQAEKDVDGIVNFVKDFISAYNDLMADLDEKLTTKTKSEYEPLTDEEKESMSDKQIEKIEDYIKDGIFYRDESLMAVRDTLRDTIGGVVTGTSKYNSLFSIGVTTGDWREQGKLYLTDDGTANCGLAKLKKAIEENPDDVVKIFAGTSSVDSEKGIFTRIYDQMYAVKGSLSSSLDEIRSFGSFYNDKLLTNDMKDIADRLLTLNQKYTEQETRLYKKFTAMEKTISQLNSQQSYLTSMMAQ